MTEFEQKVLQLVKKIPRGRVTTYKLLGNKLGNVRLARPIGNALNKNEKLIKIPCHRVIKSNGHVGGYKLNIGRKIKLLREEGIKIKNKRINNFVAFLYKF